MSSPQYVVRALGWYQPPHGDPYTRRLPGEHALATFGTFGAADDYRAELEAEARAGENPFRFGGGSVFFQSSLDGPRLHDWLMDAGIEPPASELRHGDWRAWWVAFAHTWTGDQLAHAWAAFDKVRFFDVVGAAPHTAHVRLAVADEGNRNLVPLRSERGQLAGVTRRAPPASRFSETVAVPSDVPPLAGAGFLVQRRVVLNQTVPGERNEAPANVRAPLALFAARPAAEAHRDALARAARATLNPFVFAEPDGGPASADGRAALAALGFPLPVPDADRRADWLEWYDLCQDDSGDDHRAAVWDLCDQPLFEVLGVTVRDG
ncbi:MAG: hypothetical protein FJ304_02045 [Planctomycetes bacterium]|nr:hypothetical protein [Planctomycetota bacterium]